MTRRAALAAGVGLALLGVTAPAGALEEKWPSDKDANGHYIKNLPTPTVATNPARVQDVAPGACIPKSPGANTLPFICSVPETDYITPAYTFGGDLSGTPASANVVGVTVSGPTHLTFGAWADGALPKRSGSTIIGATSGTDYLVPGATSAGNYDRVSVAASGLVTGGATMVAANVTALEALAGANYRDGSEVFVQSVAAYFQLHTSSSLTVDHIVAGSVSGLSGARWLRGLPRDGYWASQATWDIDPANSTGLCSDETTGADATHPLCSFAEFSRRLTHATLTQTTYTVTLMSDAPDTDPMYLFGVDTLQRTTSINVVGTTSVVATRTMSAVHVPASDTANDHYELTDSGGSFSSWIGTNLLHRTTTASAYFWPYKDLGSGKLQISIPVDDAVANKITMAGGDSYQVLAMPTFAEVFLHNCTRRLSVSIQKVRVIGAAVASGVPVPSSTGPLLEYRHSLFQTSTSVAFTAAPIGLQLVLSDVAMAASVGAGSFTGHVTLSAGLYAGNGTTSTIQTNSELTLLGDAIPATLGGRSMTFTHQTSVDKFAAMVYDWTSGSTPAFTVQLNSRVYFTGIGGERNTGKLVWSDRGSLAMNVNAITAGITSDSTPFNSDGTTYATVPSATNTSLNSIYAFPSKIFETGGSALLSYGAVPDGSFVQRSGTSLIGTTTIPGTSVGLTATRVGFGSAGNTLTGSDAAIFDDSSIARLTLGNGSTKSGRINLNSVAGTSNSILLQAAGTTFETWSGSRDGTAVTGRVLSQFTITPVSGGNNDDRLTFGSSVGNGTTEFAVFVENSHQDVALGGLTGGSALATSDTYGFVWLPRMPGAPTGVPSRNGSATMLDRQATVLDVSHRRFYYYDTATASWHWVAFDDGATAASAITSLTTDVVATGPGASAATIQPGVVTNAKLANMTAPAFKGRTTAGAGAPEDLTATQATAMLNVFSSSLKGLAPASGGGTTNFLRADGSWAAPGGGVVTNVTATLPVESTGGATPDISVRYTNTSITLSAGNALQRAALAGGDVTAPADSNVLTIGANAVSNPKFRQSLGLSVVGRALSSTGDVDDITAASDGQVLRRSGTTIAFGSIVESAVTNLTTDLAAKAPVGATYITQTPDGTLTNEQALNSLGAGVVSVNASGVLASTGFTAGRIAHGSGSNGTLTDSSLLYFASPGGVPQLAVGTSSPDANFNATIKGTNSSGVGSLRVGVVGTAGDFNMVMDSVTLGPYLVAHTNLDGTSSANAGGARMEFGGNGLVVRTSPATAVSSPRTFTTRFQVAINGDTTVGSLGTGIVKSTVGLLATATSNVDYQAAITWPAPGRFTIAPGTFGGAAQVGGNPVSGSHLQYDFTTDFVAAEDDASFAAYAVGSTGSTNASYLHMFGSSGLNTVNVVAERRGSTAVPALNVSAGTATLTLSGATVTASATSAAALSAPAVSATGTTSATVSAPTTTILGSSTAQFGTTFGAILQTTSDGLLVQSTPSIASGTSATGDAVEVTLNTLITGSTNITTATGFNGMTVRAPTYTDNDASILIDQGATFVVTGAPNEGTGVTFNHDRYAVWVQASASRFDGIVVQSEASATAAANVALGVGGNFVSISGNTQIQTMSINGSTLHAGTAMTLVFAGNPTVKHKTGTGAQFDLAGDVDYTTAAGATLTVVYDGTYWKETGRAAP